MTILILFVKKDETISVYILSLKVVMKVDFNILRLINLFRYLIKKYSCGKYIFT